VNGDSRPDLAWFSSRRATQTIWKTQQNGTILEGTLGASTQGYASAWPIGKAFRRTGTIDFNADGISDVLLQATETKGMSLLLLGNGDDSFREVAGADSSVSSHTPSYGDLNGDGQTDILWDMEDDHGRSRGNRILWLSKGDGTFNKLANAGGLDGTLAASQHRPYLVDVNGDGRPDVFWDAKADNSARSTGQRTLWLATGESGFTAISNFAGQDGTLVDYAVNFGDFNGDGKTDFFWDKHSGTDSRSQGQRVLWLSDGVVPDMMTGATTGVGATTSFTYKSLTEGAVYTRDVGAVDPIVELQGAMAVVSRIQQANGVGGQRSIAYRYAGAKAHVEGRGFLGFRQITTTDEQTGITQTATYRQEHPFTGLVAQEVTRKDGVTLSSSTNTHEAVDLGGSRSQVTLKQSAAAGADLDGIPLPSSTTTYQYDAYGNATQISVAMSDGYGKTTTNTYSNNPSNWLLGRLLTATVTSQVPEAENQAPDTKPSAFGFTDLTDAAPATVYETSVVITGYNRSLTATVAGDAAEIRKNDTGDWANSVSLSPGDRLNLRLKSSPTAGAAVSATVTVGGVSGSWIISNSRLITIGGNVNGFNLRVAHDALYAAPTGSENPRIHVRVVIEPNVVVGATSTASPAFTVGNWPVGIPIQIINRGLIIGAGGDGGHGGRPGSAVGANGGTAFYTRYPLTLHNEGNIAGGGGGGGGGHGQSLSDTAGGGGGGAGVPGGQGAAGNPNAVHRTGAAGTTLAGGNGGVHTSSGTPAAGGAGFGMAGSNAGGRGGGGGGGPGAAGGNGAGRNGRLGGQPGAATDGDRFITYNGVGGIWGARVSGSP
jgi:hypothetical protein